MGKINLIIFSNFFTFFLKFFYLWYSKYNLIKMSFNQLMYDQCATSQYLRQSVSPLAFRLDPIQYENCNKCRIELGTVGGSAVSNISGNLVDLESDLKGITRLNSKCPTLDYQMPCPQVGMGNCQPNKIRIRGTPTTRARNIDTRLVHLSPCQMHRYKPVPLPPAISYPKCG